MKVQDLRSKVLNEIDNINAQLEGQMIVNWQLEGKKAAYKNIKDMLSEMANETIGESLRNMTDKELEDKGYQVSECYLPRLIDNKGVKCYGENIVVDAFINGAKWILSQLKVN